MANSTSVRLQKVRDAIDALMDGGAVQSYEINGRQLSHYSLTQLMDLEKRLVKQLADEQSGGNTNFVRFGRAK